MDLYHTLQSNKPDEDIFQRPICLVQFLIIFFLLLLNDTNSRKK
jgi:hypothetical protein